MPTKNCRRNLTSTNWFELWKHFIFWFRLCTNWWDHHVFNITFVFFKSHNFWSWLWLKKNHKKCLYFFFHIEKLVTIIWSFEKMFRLQNRQFSVKSSLSKSIYWADSLQDKPSTARSVLNWWKLKLQRNICESVFIGSVWYGELCERVWVHESLCGFIWIQSIQHTNTTLVF